MRLLEDYFSTAEKTLISDQIWEAEQKTSGEIRVYFERKIQGNNLENRALEVFSRLRMDETELRNGVLFYIAFDDRKYAVIGDKGIHSKVDTDFWESISDVMKEHFSRGDFIQGLSLGIEEVGEKLKTFFPIVRDNINELPNEIAFEKDLKDEEE